MCGDRGRVALRCIVTERGGSAMLNDRRGGTHLPW